MSTITEETKQLKIKTEKTSKFDMGINLDEDYGRTIIRDMLTKIREADLEKIAIFSGFVDPDGLSSMYTLAAILEMWGHNPTCFYRGSFSRPQNKIMRQVLGLNPKHESEFNADDYTCVISVDGPSQVCPVIPDFIIDHHEQGEPAKICSDIRFIGSCAAIIVEYAKEAELDFSNENGQRLATALAIGIKTDTRDFIAESASKLDFQNYAYVLSYKDNKLFKEILNYSVPHYYHELFVQGWANKEIENSVLVTGIGSIPESRRGAISYLADEYVQTENISTAVVFAMINGAIDISVRSSNSALNVDEFVRIAFGKGGGKWGAGRSRIDMPLFENIPQELSDELFNACFKIVKHKTLTFTGDKK